MWMGEWMDKFDGWTNGFICRYMYIWIDGSGLVKGRKNGYGQIKG